jgi:hypothetical protein
MNEKLILTGMLGIVAAAHRINAHNTTLTPANNASGDNNDTMVTAITAVGAVITIASFIAFVCCCNKQKPYGGPMTAEYVAIVNAKGLRCGAYGSPANHGLGSTPSERSIIPSPV